MRSMTRSMIKKIILFLCSLLLLAAVVPVLMGLRGENRSLFPMVTESALEKIRENFKVTEEDILESLTYNGEELPCDRERGVFYLPLSMAEEAWEDGHLDSGTPGTNIAFAYDAAGEDKLGLMEEGREIPFYAYTKDSVREYRLVVTGLPVIEIDGLEEEGMCRIRVLDADTKVNWVTESEASMYVRGNTSRNYPKKGYRVQLLKEAPDGGYTGNKQALLGLREDDDWILYAMYNDGTKIRDKLSIDMWNVFGAGDNDFQGKLGTDLVYAEVILNGEYYGLYGLMEPIDSKQVNLQKEDGLHLTEYMYKRKQPSELNLSELLDPSFTAERLGFEIKGGREGGDAADWEPLYELLRWQEQESDEAFAAEAEEMVDVGNTVDMWLFIQMITGYDQIAKNVYYVAKAQGGQRVFWFAPWDMDLTWGYTSDPTYPLSTKYEDFLTESYIWWQPGDRMMLTNAAGARDLAQERYAALRQELFTDEWMREKIGELEERVCASGAFARDEERWPEGNHDAQYGELLRYALERLDYLDGFMADIQGALQDFYSE